jgi:hypothetical protein
MGYIEVIPIPIKNFPSLAQFEIFLELFITLIFHSHVGKSSPIIFLNRGIGGEIPSLEIDPLAGAAKFFSW